MAAEFLATHGIDLQAEMTKVQFGDSIADPAPSSSETTTTPPSPTTSPSLPPLPAPTPLPTLASVLLPSSPTTPLTLHLSPSTSLITAITPAPPSHPPRLALPSLCHPHIHLDKAHLHSHPLFSTPPPPAAAASTFAAALATTALAKALFTPADLLTRGNWLLAESVAAGVTHLRAFVETDPAVGLVGLHAAIRLQHRWRAHCAVQLCAFAQDPLFSGDSDDDDGAAAATRRLVEQAARCPEVSALGTTPYVEADAARARRNVRWAVGLAVALRKHLDFHLDYSLDAAAAPLVWDVLAALRAEDWPARNPARTVCLGHCTRLALFSRAEWARLRVEVRGLPVFFVGLPTSDLYMMGRPPRSAEEEGEERGEDGGGGGDRPRGTLQVVWMIRALGLRAALGVNNVGNAFTPWGGADPLAVAALAVGVCQAGGEGDAEVLYECVSTRAREAIGFEGGGQGEKGVQLRVGGGADLVVYGREGGGRGERGRGSVREVVADGGRWRVVVKGGWRVGEGL
ncbi:hypothetical protein MMC15_007394 [Xylographa vitiligo]|nr:hypothetical protein [Xylographa vitiligo]